MSALSNRSRDCQNCTFAFGDATNNFCPQCGQETKIEPLSLHEYAIDWANHYFAPGGSLMRTVARLITRPGQLSIDYREGRRNQFVRPLRLVFTLVLLSFLVDAAFSYLVPEVELQGYALTAQNNKKLREITREKIISTSIERYVSDRQTAAIKREQILRERDEQLATLSQPGRNESASYLAARGKFSQRLQLYLVLLISPALALVLRGLYWNRPHRYGDYLVFSLHLACTWLVLNLFFYPVLVLKLEPRVLLGFLAAYLLAYLGYLGIAMRRAYGGEVINSAVRTLAASVAAVILAVMVSAVVIRIFDLTAAV